MSPRYALEPAHGLGGRLSSASGPLRGRDGAARPGTARADRQRGYGAGLALLMLGRREEAAEWLERAALRWRESWAHATPTSWGRPIGVVKAPLLAGGDGAQAAEWALGLGRGRPSRRSAATPRRSRCSCSERRDEAAALARQPAGARGLPARRRRRARRGRGGRRGGVQRGGARRCSRRSRRARTTWRTSPSPTRCSCCRRSHAGAGFARSCGPRRSCRPSAGSPAAPRSR